MFKENTRNEKRERERRESEKLMVGMQPNDGEQQPNSKIFNGAPKIIFPAKNSHHSPKSTHKEENIYECFCCGLNEKKRSTAQSIQNSILWCPISITKKISCFVFLSLKLF